MKCFYMLFLFFFISCSNSQKVDELIWDDTKLSSNEFENEVIFSSPRNLELFGDKLILLWPNNTSVLQFVNRYNGMSENYWGAFGNGPNEFIAPFCSKISEDTSEIYIYDQMLNVLRKYSVNDCYTSMAVEHEEEIYYKNNDIIIGDLHKINDEYLVASIIFGIDNYPMALLDKNLNIIDSFGKLKNQPQENFVFTSYTGTFTSYSNKAIFAMRNFSYIAGFEIISDKVEKKWEHYLEEPNYDVSGNLEQKELKGGFYDVKVTSNFIYCTYSGKTPDKDNYLPEMILVFDHDGNPIKRIYTDCQIATIAVSEDDKIIYATGFNPELSLRYFDISTIFD